jgi:hypothetical protein
MLDNLRSAVAIMLLLATVTVAGVLDYGDERGRTGERASVATVSPGAALVARDAEEASEDPAVHLKPLEPLLGDWDFGSLNQSDKPFRAVFQWKGNRSCIAFHTFVRQGNESIVISTGLIYWDPAVRAIRETGFDESPDLFQNGTWKPEPDRLVGEFVDHEQGGTRRKSQFVSRFVDRDTMEMTGARQFEFKRSRRGEVLPSGRAGSGSPFSLRLDQVDAQH